MNHSAAFQAPSSGAPKVSVAMTTFSHAKYIAQAIESVLMQATSFPFELVIGEDCSTDGTRDIVRRFAERHPNIVRVLFHPENIGAQANTAAVITACRGEYLAFLEGDDYWTSPRKLQRQADFLDANPGCAMCTHRVNFLNETDGSVFFEQPPEHLRSTRSLQSLLVQNSISTCSAMCRRALISPLPADLQQLRVGDWPTWILVARHGDVGYLDESMAVYRVHGTGSWSGLSGAQQLASEAEVLERIAGHLDPSLRPLALKGSQRYRRDAARAAYLHGIRTACDAQARGRGLGVLFRAVFSDPLVLFWRPFMSATVKLLFGIKSEIQLEAVRERHRR